MSLDYNENHYFKNDSYFPYNSGLNQNILLSHSEIGISYGSFDKNLYLQENFQNLNCPCQITSQCINNSPVFNNFTGPINHASHAQSQSLHSFERNQSEFQVFKNSNQNNNNIANLNTPDKSPAKNLFCK